LLEVRVQERPGDRRVDSVLEVGPVAAVAERPRVESDDGSVVEQRSSGVAEADALRDLDEPIGEGVLRGDGCDLSVAPDPVDDDDRLRRGQAAGDELIGAVAGDRERLALQVERVEVAGTGDRPVVTLYPFEIESNIERTRA
jgi:hypothetical protein